MTPILIGCILILIFDMCVAFYLMKDAIRYKLFSWVFVFLLYIMFVQYGIYTIMLDLLGG